MTNHNPAPHFGLVLDCADPDRLSGLGALRVSDDTCSERGSTWIQVADPEGNEFCICDNGSPATRETT